MPRIRPPLIADGRWPGRILDAPRGNGGFGYDPLFLPHDFDCAAAELPAEVKNRASHRGLAMAQLLALLRGAPLQPRSGP